MLNNKTIYFPAVSCGSAMQTFEKDIKHISGKSYRFYNEDAIINYPYILISAGHNCKKETQNKLDYNLDKTIVLGDSGGFQVATKAVEFSDKFKENIFNWLENNTNYAINLDIPTWNIKEEKSREYMHRLLITRNNFEYFKLNQSNKTKYLSVLQGKTLFGLDTWYDNIKEFEFDGGWAIGGTSVNLFYMFQSFFYLWEKGEIQKSTNKNAFIHFLGYSKIKSLYIILYLQEKLNKFNIDVKITYDSSYPFITAGFGHYFLFVKKEGATNLTITNNIIKEKASINKNVDLPCFCPVCNGISFQYIWDNFINEKGFTTEYYSLTMLHNFYKFLEYKGIMENVILTESKEIYESLFNTKDLDLFKFIDHCFEIDNPVQYIDQHKKYLFNLLGEDQIKKKTLF